MVLFQELLFWEWLTRSNFQLIDGLFRTNAHFMENYTQFVLNSQIAIVQWSLLSISILYEIFRVNFINGSTRIDFKSLMSCTVPPQYLENSDQICCVRNYFCINNNTKTSRAIIGFFALYHRFADHSFNLNRYRYFVINFIRCTPIYMVSL